MENGKDLAGTVLMLSKKIRSIADIGLLYSKDDYDRERYHELKDISLQLISELTACPVEHSHPPQPYYVYKFVFLCDIIGDLSFTQAFDILDTGFFKVSGLPELSEDRILRSQIEILYNNLVQQQLVPGSRLNV